MSNYMCLLIVVLLGFLDQQGQFEPHPAISRVDSSVIYRDSVKFPPCNPEAIPRYTAYKIDASVDIDGKLDEQVWLEAPRSHRFKDLISGDSTLYDTRAAVLWDEQYLYVGYWVEEPNLQASLTERDAPIYTDNDVELFIAGTDAYYEFEINTYGTIYEVLFIWESSYYSRGFDNMEAFQLHKEGVKHFNGVGYKNHPRGKRIGFWNWDFDGLKHAVFLNGTVNDSTDQDLGWTVELALPWSGMKVLNIDGAASLPPQDGDKWRMDFSRFNQYQQEPPAEDSGGWAWSPHGVWDSHIPECFTYIQFSQDLVPR